VNLFAYCTILFEFLPSGNILKSVQFTPFALYSNGTGFSLLASACEIVYIAIISFFALKEIRSLIKLGCRKYFTQFWIYIEWLLIIISYASLAMYMYRYYERIQLEKTLKSNSELLSNQREIIRLQKFSYWNDLLLATHSICAFLAIFKFLKLIRHSRNISFLVRTFSQSFRELFAFMIFFMLFWLAFVNLMYLIFNDRSKQFTTFLQSILTTFMIFAGKFDSITFFENSASILGPAMFGSFNLFMVIILLNVFTTIMSDNFGENRRVYKAEFKDEDSIIVEYLKNKFENLRKKHVEVNSAYYQTNFDNFDNKLSGLVRSIYVYSK
jgi:hypothetical protein